jgi:hypothetical protein
MAVTSSSVLLEILGRNNSAVAALKGTQDAAANAERGISGSLGRVSTIAKASTAVLLAGALAVGVAVRAGSQAYDEFQASGRKLEATSRSTGRSIEQLRSLSNDLKGDMQLSTMVSNEFTISVGRLADKAKNFQQTGPAMRAFLDIGASRGLDAAKTLEAVQQAILGIDEGTDKLFGVNPSVLYDRFAKSIGTSAGKLTDAGKAQAILNAAMEEGAKLQGSYNDFLDSAAGRQSQVAQRLQETKVAFGEAINEARLRVLEEMSNGFGVMSGSVTDNRDKIRELADSVADLIISFGKLSTLAMPHIESFFSHLTDYIRESQEEFEDVMLALSRFENYTKRLGLDNQAEFGGETPELRAERVRQERRNQELDKEWRDRQQGKRDAADYRSFRERVGPMGAPNNAPDVMDYRYWQSQATARNRVAAAAGAAGNTGPDGKPIINPDWINGGGAGGKGRRSAARELTDVDRLRRQVSGATGVLEDQLRTGEDVARTLETINALFRNVSARVEAQRGSLDENAVTLRRMREELAQAKREAEDAQRVSRGMGAARMDIQGAGGRGPDIITQTSLQREQVRKRNADLQETIRRQQEELRDAVHNFADDFFNSMIHAAQGAQTFQDAVEAMGRALLQTVGNAAIQQGVNILVGSVTQRVTGGGKASGKQQAMGGISSAAGTIGSALLGANPLVGGALIAGGLGISLLGNMFGGGSARERENEQFRAHLRALRQARAEEQMHVTIVLPNVPINPRDPDFKEAVAATVYEIAGTGTGKVEFVTR